MKPGLVAFYDIRPGNGAGLFLQPQSRHGALVSWCFTALSSHFSGHDDVYVRVLSNGKYASSVLKHTTDDITDMYF